MHDEKDSRLLLIILIPSLCERGILIGLSRYFLLGKLSDSAPYGIPICIYYLHTTFIKPSITTSYLPPLVHGEHDFCLFALDAFLSNVMLYSETVLNKPPKVCMAEQDMYQACATIS